MTYLMEQVTRIELVTKPWQGFILPLNYTCIKYGFLKVSSEISPTFSIKYYYNTKINSKSQYLF